MATTLSGWLADGSPWKPSTPVADFKATLTRYGFTVYVLGNDDHQHADPPEDHTAFSHTPWPEKQPYPYILACDVMPGGRVDWRDLGAQVVRDKMAGVPGTEWIKYVNWTDRDGNVWQDSWQPNHVHRRSTDTGHLHFSGRTDFVTSSVAAGYDPVARLLGDTVTLKDMLAEDVVPNPPSREDSPGHKPAGTNVTIKLSTWLTEVYERVTSAQSRAGVIVNALPGLASKADVAAIGAKLDALAATPPGTATIPDEQLERVFRKVLGGVDGATPPPGA